MKIYFSIMSQLQSHFHFRLDLQKMDQHTGGKGLIHGTRHPIIVATNIIQHISTQNIRGIYDIICFVISSETKVIETIWAVFM